MVEGVLGQVGALRAVHAVRSAGGSSSGGDLVRVESLDASRTALVVIDVCGSGADRAPRAALLASVCSVVLAGDDSPAAALRAAHAAVSSASDEFAYAVAFCAVVPSDGLTATYASAGLDGAFVIDDADAMHPLPVTAPMLGIPAPFDVAERTVAFAAGDRLVVVTDGISEARAPGQDAFFGLDRIAAAVCAAAGSNAADAILDAARAFARSPLRDDAAAVVATPLDVLR